MAAEMTREPFGLQLRDLLFADTRPTRFILLIVAAVKTGLLLLPGDSLERAAYAMMRALFPEVVWTWLFGSYTIAAIACLFYYCNVWFAMLINAYGLALFTMAFVSFVAAGLYPVPVIIASQVGCVIAAFWVFIRTGSQR